MVTLSFRWFILSNLVHIATNDVTDMNVSTSATTSTFQTTDYQQETTSRATAQDETSSAPLILFQTIPVPILYMFLMGLAFLTLGAALLYTVCRLCSLRRGQDKSTIGMGRTRHSRIHGRAQSTISIDNDYVSTRGAGQSAAPTEGNDQSHTRDTTVPQTVPSNRNTITRAIDNEVNEMETFAELPAEPSSTVETNSVELATVPETDSDATMDATKPSRKEESETGSECSGYEHMT